MADVHLPGAEIQRVGLQTEDLAAAPSAAGRQVDDRAVPLGQRAGQGVDLLSIYICAVAGKDLLSECRCFRSLAKNRTGEALKATLAEKLDSLERDNPSST